ncbi:MAG: Peptidase M23 [uncultured bacterium (gcode 4)]|uniref:Peptidase M23 n=1 Tax=uncultured bacterium (gcode 4) TaxID=1234023 RepID=K2F5I0_9BACT|nr:MAG: Peptidase M23 [uncultured bacterium (gcode 4)]
MKIANIFAVSFLITFWIFPLSINSADIYEKSDWESKIISSLNQNTISWNDKLNSNIFIVKTWADFINPKIFSSCNIAQEILYKNKSSEWNITIIKILVNDSNCTDNKIYLKNWDIIYTDTLYNINISSYPKILNKLLDLKSDDIKKKTEENKFSVHKLDNEIFKLKQEKDLNSRIKMIEKVYKMNFLEYENNILSYILKKRTNFRYVTPVKWKGLPLSRSLVPNAWRWYRKDVTDGIHHWYDILASRWTPTQALWDWIILRIKRNFSWNDFSNIKRWNLSFDDKLLNLDIYRWNQVWIKTFDGNITFYSHLWDIWASLSEWQFIKAWEYIWTIDKTWVPDKEYKDYHLHFEIQKNPFINTGNKTNLDIMRWNWFWEGKNYKTIIEEQKKLFN